MQSVGCSTLCASGSLVVSAGAVSEWLTAVTFTTCQLSEAGSRQSTTWQSVEATNRHRLRCIDVILLGRADADAEMVVARPAKYVQRYRRVMEGWWQWRRRAGEAMPCSLSEDKRIGSIERGRWPCLRLVAMETTWCEAARVGAWLELSLTAAIQAQAASATWGSGPGVGGSRWRGWVAARRSFPLCPRPSLRPPAVSSSSSQGRQPAYTRASTSHSLSLSCARPRNSDKVTFMLEKINRCF